MEELRACGVRGVRGANPVARSVDSDERETSHFAVYPAMNLEFLMDVDRAGRGGQLPSLPRRRFVPNDFLNFG